MKSNDLYKLDSVPTEKEKTSIKDRLKDTHKEAKKQIKKNLGLDSGFNIWDFIKYWFLICFLPVLIIYLIIVFMGR